MSKTKKPVATGGDVQKGYNEKNPTQPQGAFKADSMQKTAKVPKAKKTAKK
jgi:hypothetical protein